MYFIKFDDITFNYKCNTRIKKKPNIKSVLCSTIMLVNITQYRKKNCKSLELNILNFKSYNSNKKHVNTLDLYNYPV